MRSNLFSKLEEGEATDPDNITNGSSNPFEDEDVCIITDNLSSPETLRKFEKDMEMAVSMLKESLLKKDREVCNMLKKGFDVLIQHVGLNSRMTMIESTVLI